MDDEGLNLAKIIAWSHLSAQAIQLGLVDSSQINSCDQMMRQGLYRTLWEELVRKVIPDALRHDGPAL